MKRIIFPPMLVELIHSGIANMDDRIFSGLEHCPSCGGELKGHDYRKKKFATVLEDGMPKDIHVRVKRYYCTKCGRLQYANAPFYPDTRLGAPIVDFCIANISKHPYYHISRLLLAMDIIVDRGTVRNYASRKVGYIPAIEMFNVMLPVSLLSLSENVLRSDKQAAIKGAEPFRPGGLPPAERALLHLAGGLKKRN